ncbi:MAG: PEGA domain-containing protein [Deltaproteobacteria bacterium]|nr:PEGA domain-containing protein [Deltaproteobacteria bacterium]
MKSQLIFLCVVLTATIAPRVHANQGAAQAFKLGSERFAAKDYAGAVEAFLQAYNKQPHFLVLCNIARCYERQRKPVAATSFYQRCLDEGASRKRPTAKRVRRALRKQSRLIARLKVEIPQGTAALYLDGKALGRSPKQLALDPGRYRLEARRPGYKAAVVAIELGVGQKRTLVLRPTPLPKVRANAVFSTGDRRASPEPEDEVTPAIAVEEDPDERIRFGAHPAWFWVSVAATGVLAIATTVLGAQALGKKSDYEENPTQGGYDAAVDSRLLANIFWALTAATAAGTTVLFFITDFTGGEEKTSAGINGIGIGLRGRF